jgi:peptide-methionine (R)-S-oxide reductase
MFSICKKLSGTVAKDEVVEDGECCVLSAAERFYTISRFSASCKAACVFISYTFTDCYLTAFNPLTNMKLISIFLMFLACNTASLPADQGAASVATPATEMSSDSIVPPQYDAQGELVKVTKSKEDWKKQLAADAYRVLREEGTERAFTGKLWENHDKGIYVCAGCGLPLFASETKFDSGTGWPSFYQPLSKDCIVENEDRAYGMVRLEVECARCGGHQGHVFDDGPKPTGLRYCINSVSLKFVKE